MFSRTHWILTGMAVLLAAGVSSSMGSRTTRWTISSPEDYQRGTLENVVVSSTGELSLGPALTRLDMAELTVWCSAVDARSGAIMFGTGTEGKLYALTPNKELKEVAKTGELVVTALAFGPAGKLYAATIPNGKVFAFDPAAGTLSPFCTLPDGYVWSLIGVPGDTLVAGTGPDGKVYRIDAQGKAAVWFETKQSHVLSLATEPAGTVYAGTAPNGVLLRIAPDGKGEVVFNTDEQEIRALAWEKDALWIGANKSKKFDPKKFVRRLQAAAAQAQQGEEKESPFQELFDGSVYRMAAGRPARLVRSFAKSYLTSIAVDQRGGVIVGTGDEGIVWRINEDGTATLLAKLKEAQVMTLPMVGGEPAALGTGNPGSVSLLTNTGPRTGSFTTEIVDAKFPAAWGTLSWDATGPLAVQTRSGKTARPDDGTWSDWSAAMTESGAKVSSPVGRYFQSRFTWKEDPKAALRWITLYYKTENQQPDVKEFEVESFDENQAFLGKARESSEVVLRWKGADPDGDELVYRVYYQRERRDEWVPLTKEPLAKKDFKWATQEMADGWYRVKVVASDEPTNPGETTLTAVKVSRPILIDNRKPAFEDVKFDGRSFSGTAADQAGVVARVEYSVDGGAWQFVLPADGLYDQRAEQVRFTLPKTSASGVHSLTVRAFDGAGNLAVYQESFRME
ncbi:MAG: hypothetical protein HYY16_00540 [Planctomycetes bacterium]|nr:hypothetical protein [Planctomycetota bacterium]